MRLRARRLLVSSRLVLAASVISSVAACSSEREPIGRLGGALEPVPPARLDPPSIDGSATVQINNPFPDSENLCTGTLVAPTVVLTAAHCVKGWESTAATTMFVHADPAPGEDSLQSVAVVGCSVHPYAHPGCAPTCNCYAVGARSPTATFAASFDLAVVTLARSFEGITARRLSPPAICSDAGRPLAVLLRGFGPVLDRPRRRLAATATVVGATLHVTTPEGSEVEFGDSGGPVESLDVPGGPILGVISQSQPFPAVTLASLLWAPATLPSPPLPPLDPEQLVPTVNWVWSQLPSAFVATLPRSDGDDLPDDHDLCPHVESPTAGQHDDTDGDFVGNDCEACHGSCDHDDPDGDGICSGLDACPSVARSRSMTDADGDHVPDACDPCGSHAPAAESACHAPCDTDDDGRTDSECPAHCDSDGDGVGDECDNCGTRNPLQENCNRDAEDALLASSPSEICSPACGPLERCMGGRCVLIRRGDACDPTPCGETWLERSDDMASDSAELGITNVRVDGLSTLRLPLGTGTRARTGMRFCRCSAAREDTRGARLTCTQPQLDGTGSCGISQIAAYRVGEEHPQWRWTTMSFAVPPRDRLSGEAGQTEALASYDLPTDAPETDLQATWHLNDDLARMGIASATFVPGVLWTHTPGTRSMLYPDVTPDSTGATRQLTSHYFSGGVERSRTVRVVGPFECFADIAPALIPDRACLTCSAGFPGAWLLAPRAGTRCLAPPPRLPVLRVPAGDLQSDDVFSMLVGRLLTDGSAVWVPAAEPAPWLPRTGLVYASVTPDGTAAGARIVTTETGLALAGFNPPPDHGPLFALAAAVPPSDAPPARTEHGLVMSSRRETLWVIGGVDASGAPLDDLWAYDLSAERWHRVAVVSSIRPERVLAATYDAASDALCVIDEVADAAPHGRPRARLLVIDVLGRSVRVAAEWPRVLPHTRFALAADASGALWLAASAAAHGGHVVVRVRAHEAGLDLLGFETAPGVLASRWARADGRGLSLLVRPPGRSGRDEAALPVGHAAEDLQAGERRAFERIF